MGTTVAHSNQVDITTLRGLKREKFHTLFMEDTV